MKIASGHSFPFPISLFWRPKVFSLFLDSAQYGDTITSNNVRYWTHSISEKKSKYVKEKMTEKYAKIRRRKCRKSRRQKIRQNNSVESGRRRTRTELEHMYLRYNVHDSAVLHQYLINDQFQQISYE